MAAITRDQRNPPGRATVGQAGWAAAALVVLLILLGVGGVGGGIVFLADPTGGLMGTPRSILHGLPIDNFVLPGIVIFSLFGVLPILLAGALLRAKRLLAQAGLANHRITFAGISIGAWWWVMLMMEVALAAWLAFQFHQFGLLAPIQPILCVQDAAMLALTLGGPVRRLCRGRAGLPRTEAG